MGKGVDGTSAFGAMAGDMGAQPMSVVGRRNTRRIPRIAVD
jgi:hypothetical protein